MEKIVLYIHGMGGGGDSRIPSILRDTFANPVKQLSSTEGAALGYNPLRGSTLASCPPSGYIHTLILIRDIEGWHVALHSVVFAIL